MLSRAMDMVAASQVRPCLSKLNKLNAGILSRQFGLKTRMPERQARMGFHCQAEAAQDTTPSQPYIGPYEKYYQDQLAKMPRFRTQGLIGFVRVLNKGYWREQGTREWHQLPVLPIVNVTRRDVFESCGGSLFVLKQMPDNTCRFFEMDMTIKELKWADRPAPPGLGDLRCHCIWNNRIYIFTQACRTWWYDLAKVQWFCSDIVDVRPFFAYSLQRAYGFGDKIIGDFCRQLRMYDPMTHKWYDNYGAPKEDRLTYYVPVGGRILAVDREGNYETVNHEGKWEHLGKLKSNVCEICEAVGNEFHIELYNGMERMEMDWATRQLTTKEDLQCEDLKGCKGLTKFYWYQCRGFRGY